MPHSVKEVQETKVRDGDVRGEAMSYLKLQGYVLTKSWDWLSPKDHVPTEDECKVISYLMREHNFGSIIGEVKE